jgi:hypothetical protein
MMFTLSSVHYPFISLSLTEYGEPHLPAIHRNTFRRLNTHPLLKNLSGKVMSLTSLRKTTR